MKRVTIAALLLVFLLILSACGRGQTQEPSQPAASDAQTENTMEASVDSDKQTEITPGNYVGADEQTEGELDAEAETAADPQGEQGMIYAHIGEYVLEIEPAENSSAEAFTELLKDGDVTVGMHDYGNFEKVGPLGSELPTNDESITTEPGDVILYQGDQITIYYDTNNWSFTRLGKVKNMSQDKLKKALGDGDVTVVFSLDKNSP